MKINSLNFPHFILRNDDDSSSLLPTHGLSSLFMNSIFINFPTWRNAWACTELRKFESLDGHILTEVQQGEQEACLLVSVHTLLQICPFCSPFSAMLFAFLCVFLKNDFAVLNCP